MLRGFLVVPALLFAAVAARADPFAIDLVAQAGKASQTAHAESAGFGAVAKPRPVLEAPAGQAVTVKWTLRCTDSKRTFNEVIAHFLAVKEEKAGQRAVPKLDKDVAAESALNMDFKPKDAADGQLTFTIKEPGAYLLRLETIGAGAGADGQEYFAALDLVVR